MNLNMHNSITTKKSVVKYNIIDECCDTVRGMSRLLGNAMSALV